MTPWTAASHAHLSMGFSRQEYWSGLSFPPSGDLPDPGIDLTSPALQADSLLSEPRWRPWKYSYDTIMVDTWHYAFVQTHGMHKTKNEP